MSFLINPKDSSSNIKKLNIIKREIFNIPTSFSLLESKKIIYYSKNEYYIGQVNNEYIPEGEGVYFYPNKEIYYGDFLEGKKYGIGVYKYLDDCFYIGNWENNLKEGEGVYYNFNKKWYFHGSFKKDLPFLGSYYTIDDENKLNEGEIKLNKTNEKWESLFEILKKTGKKDDIYNNNFLNDISMEDLHFELTSVRKKLFDNENNNDDE
jgi:hypothetical protein